MRMGTVSGHSQGGQFLFRIPKPAVSSGCLHLHWYLKTVLLLVALGTLCFFSNCLKKKLDANLRLHQMSLENAGDHNSNNNIGNWCYLLSLVCSRFCSKKNLVCIKWLNLHKNHYKCCYYYHLFPEMRLRETNVMAAKCKKTQTLQTDSRALINSFLNLHIPTDWQSTLEEKETLSDPLNTSKWVRNIFTSIV